MPRATPSAVLTPWRGETPEPIHLIELTARDGSIVRICTGDGDVTFAGNVYAWRPLAHDEVAVEEHAETPATPLRFADADGFWKAQEDLGRDFVGGRVRIIRTDRSALAGAGSDAVSLSDRFVVESWRRAQGGVHVELLPLLSLLEQEIPKRTVTRRTFPGIPDINSIP